MTLDLGTWLQAAIALAVVLALLLIAARLLRAGGVTAREGRRLAVSEALALDARRRLLLVRCDGREAVLLVGGPADLMLGWVPQATEGPRA